MMRRITCRHCCRSGLSERSRLLCHSCYSKTQIRRLYPAQDRSEWHGTRRVDFSGGYELPEPTAALPGTLEKLEVLAKRVEAGKALFHPEDLKREV